MSDGYELDLQAGDYNELATQLIEYSDFPLDEIEIWTGRANAY